MCFIIQDVCVEVCDRLVKSMGFVKELLQLGDGSVYQGSPVRGGAAVAAITAAAGASGGGGTGSAGGGASPHQHRKHVARDAMQKLYALVFEVSKCKLIRRLMLVIWLCDFTCTGS